MEGKRSRPDSGRVLPILLPELGEFFFEASKPLEILVFRRLRRHDGDPPTVEQRLDESIGVAHDGMGESPIERAVESKDSSDGLALREVTDGFGQFPNQQLTKLLQLLDDLAGRQASGSGHLPVGLAYHEPEFGGLPSERTSQLNHQVYHEREIAVDGGEFDVRGLGHSSIDPLRPLGNEMVPLLPEGVSQDLDSRIRWPHRQYTRLGPVTAKALTRRNVLGLKAEVKAEYGNGKHDEL
jgi:hypothetical protein